MLISAPLLRRAVAGALGAGAVTGALVFGAAPMASAQPPVAPGCTAADFSGVASGVSASTSAYLFTHPEVNNFFSGLHGLPADQLRPKVVDYMNANPQVKAELTGIRQPLIDIKNRCGFSESDPNGPLVP
ncbi:heme-binding protein [Mycolicibacterium psychrotolerans]|uniref:Membrane protein n=1 Tax=Mycolicibacterium psychrotolerans TaxID=216929 RepID=A0A7I7M4U8_9MYCO|nr:heme-binding protein [Mycolicibacterium psychrotolerans]BBX67218.1 membrane protein [Mycolicibacterium psychrotolerans]